MKKLHIIILLFFTTYLAGQAQYTTLNAHSHNDYLQKIPFYLAYKHHFGSIEADIWVVNGDLLVAHDKKNISLERSLDALYINPIVKLFSQNGQKAWVDFQGSFMLLIDIKSNADTTLKLLVEKMKKYSSVFDRTVNKNAIRVVITGNRPDPSSFDLYPGFIYFDGKLTLKYSDEQLKRVALYSENLEALVSWKGDKPLAEREQTRLKLVIDSVHRLHHTVRFWNAPDVPLAWETLMNLKVDYINTDHISELSDYLEKK